MVFLVVGYVLILIEVVCQFLQIVDVGGDSSNMICLIDIFNFCILQVIFFGEDDSGVEILVMLENIFKDDECQSLWVYFIYFLVFGFGWDFDVFVLFVSVDVEVLFGEFDESLLFVCQVDLFNLVDVVDDCFYGILVDCGYGYIGLFCVLFSFCRKLGKVVVQVFILLWWLLDELGLELLYENMFFVYFGMLDGVI